VLRLNLGRSYGIALCLEMRLQGTVDADAKGALHIAFLGDGLPSAEADRISLTTIEELVRVTKSDHVAFVKRVADAVANGQKQAPDSLASSHRCRLGLWYDDVSDGHARSLPSFKAMKAPHDAVHELGRRALGALGSDEMATARQCVAEMRSHSEHVLRCLDEFGRDYPTTLAKAAA
jgi:hypothetical protein